MVEPQQVDPVEELGDDPAAKQIHLPREQQVPDGMVLVGERLPIPAERRSSPKSSLAPGPGQGRWGGEPLDKVEWWRGLLRLLVQHETSFSNAIKKPAERMLGGSEAGEMPLVARQLVPTSQA